MSRRLLRLGLFAWLVTAGVQVRSAAPPGEWRAWAGDVASTRYSSLDQITASNVANLKIAWRQSATPAALTEGRANVFPAPGNYQHTPLMVGGLLYMSTGLGVVAALDPATGRVVWFDRSPAAPDGGQRSGEVANRGVAYWTDGQDERILTLVGQYLVALDAKTGRRYPAFGVNGEVDLRQGLSRPYESYNWRSAPIVVRNVVVIGSVVGDINNAARPSRMEAPPGDVRGYDVRSGKLLWTFRPIPRPASSATRRGKKTRGRTPAT